MVFEKYILGIINIEASNWVIIIVLALLNWARMELKIFASIHECTDSHGHLDKVCANMNDIAVFTVIGDRIHTYYCSVHAYVLLCVCSSRGDIAGCGAGGGHRFPLLPAQGAGRVRQPPRGDSVHAAGAGPRAAAAREPRQGHICTALSITCMHYTIHE